MRRALSRSLAAILVLGWAASGCGARGSARPAATVSGQMPGQSGGGAPGPVTTAPSGGRPVRVTLYHLASQPCPDAAQVALPRCGGGAIALVSHGFLKAAKMQGSAKLCDGRVVSVGKLSPVCFRVAAEGFPWGATASGRPAAPFRSIAVDPKVFTLGRWYYVRELDGLALPPPAEGKKHDGCVRADDVGGAVKGDLVDLFVGSRAAVMALGARLTSFHLADGDHYCAQAGPL
ncbi:MAG: hypothetical protein HYV09_04580 [Deltaproteobacteria bacterium]|nr:hypothetical protein [Deltaproteobacteria bacterium]